MTRSLFAALAVAALVAAGRADDKPKPAKVTVAFRGVATEEDAVAIRKAVGKIAGVTIKVDEIVPGEKGGFKHYFSPPVVMEIADLNTTDLGAVAKVVAEVKTEERKEVPRPSLALVLFTPNLDVTSERVKALREALLNVPGQEGQMSGGLGGVRGERRYWVRFDASGAGKLDDVLAAVKKADIEMELLKK